MGRLEGKIAIVTGGASGIGLAISRGFAAEGAKVCVADINADACQAAADAIGHGAIGNVLDVRNPLSVSDVVARVVSHWGGVDTLVNCAGVFGMQALAEIKGDEFDRVMAVNAKGLLVMISAASTQMIAQKRGGTIVSIASGSGRRGVAGAAIYAASKAAAISITQSAALELVGHGIRVNAIAPGAVRTPMWQEVDRKFSAVLGLELGSAEAVQVSYTPLGRMAEPEEFAGPAIFLACDDSSYVVGQTINVCGGMYMA
jgi:NAD(P)-dependent dehydrogenase (short-subunit alcohol dehydrogenase family)